MLQLKYMGTNIILRRRYRVDALHSDTYKIRGGLYRNMKEKEVEENKKVKIRVSVVE